MFILPDGLHKATGRTLEGPAVTKAQHTLAEGSDWESNREFTKTHTNKRGIEDRFRGTQRQTVQLKTVRSFFFFCFVQEINRGTFIFRLNTFPIDSQQWPELSLIVRDLFVRTVRQDWALDTQSLNTSSATSAALSYVLTFEAWLSAV